MARLEIRRRISGGGIPRGNESAGDVKELYRSNAGTLDLDKNVISGDGGLEESYAKAMDMKANQLRTAPG